LAARGRQSSALLKKTLIKLTKWRSHVTLFFFSKLNKIDKSRDRKVFKKISKFSNSKKSRDFDISLKKFSNVRNNLKNRNIDKSVRSNFACQRYALLREIPLE